MRRNPPCPLQVRETPAPEPVLDSWKEIADYLGRDVRTLQRWEHRRKLPIHRLPGGTKPAVYALKSELDDWSKRVPPREEPSGAGLAQSAHGVATVAVLPFSDLSGDKDSEYFSDGLADEIINALTRLPGLKVTARSSSFACRALRGDIQRIGTRLNAQAILKGSVRRSGNRIRVFAQLIDASSGHEIWNDRFDRERKEIFTIQDAILRAIAERLGVPLTARQIRPRRQPANVDSYDLWMKGRHHFFRCTPDELQKSVECFEQAIAADPAYAPAHLGVAEAGWEEASLGLVPPLEAAAKGRTSIAKALEADPTLGEAHATLGVYRGMCDFDWPGAEECFRRALQLSGTNPLVRSRYACYYLVPMQRLEEALAEMRPVLELDPLSPKVLTQVGQLYYLLRQYQRAEELLNTAVTLDSSDATTHWMVGRVQALQGRTKKGIAAAERAALLFGESPAILGALGRMYGVQGREEKAREVLARMEALPGELPVSPAAMAWVWLGLGDLDRTFQWLDRAVEYRDPCILHLGAEPIYDRIRADGRFDALLRKMRLKP